MTDRNIGTWLLVVLAIVGLAFATPVVSAHGTETTADGTPPYNGTATEWAMWMGSHMTEHMGSGSVEWMESHMGVTVDEMARDMADGDYDHGYGMYGQGRGC